MKKIFTALFLSVVTIILLPSSVMADMGPKPSITIKAVNMPDADCYMDLLVQSEDDGELNYEFLEPEYNSKMINILASYNTDNWRAGIINNLIMTFDNVRCEIENGLCTKRISYMPPDTYRIIVVTEDGKTVISNIIERKSFKSTVSFDYEKGVAEQQGAMTSVFFQFLLTLSLTLIIEGLLLIAFRFSMKKYWRPFLLVNLFTQFILGGAISVVMYTAGMLGAIITYFIAEFLILVIEGVVYGVILKQHPVARRIIYALTANIVSFAAGVIILFFFG